MNPYRKIALGLDGSKASEVVISRGFEIADTMNAEIVGFHVSAIFLHDAMFSLLKPFFPKLLQNENLESRPTSHRNFIGQKMEIISRAYLEPLQREGRFRGVGVKTFPLMGKPWRDLLANSKSENADLLIIGRGGKGKSRKTGLGSVADKLSQFADLDLWLSGHHNCVSGPVIVAIDGSEASSLALLRSIKLCKAFSSKLHIVAVNDLSFHLKIFNQIEKIPTEATNSENLEKLKALFETVVLPGFSSLYRNFLDEALSKAKAEGVEAFSHLLNGKVVETIQDFSRKNNPRVVILGRRGFHWAEPERIGSNSFALARSLQHDVLLVV